MSDLRKKHLSKMNRVMYSQTNKKTLKRYIRKEFMNDEGYAVININLYNGIQLFNPLSYKHQLALNPDVYKYIDDKVKILPKHVPIKLIFRGQKISEPNQELIRQLIREHYSIKLNEKQREIDINRRKILILFAIGAYVLFLYFYLILHLNHQLYLEILSIIGTFSIWEGADFFILEKTDLNVEKMHITQKLIQEIAFEE